MYDVPAQAQIVIEELRAQAAADKARIAELEALLREIIDPDNDWRLQQVQDWESRVEDALAKN